MIRYFATLMIAFVLAFCAASPVQADDSSHALQEVLLSFSVADFEKHGPHPDRVRDVHLRYLEKDNGDRIYLLCGQFWPSSDVVKPTWTDFATLQTSSYEQWIGGQAAALCENSLPPSPASGDLSSRLQERLDGNRSAEE